MTAKVDNFDPSNTATYQQRYWYNPNFSKGNEVVFLMIQGESEATDKWITNKGREFGTALMSIQITLI